MAFINHRAREVNFKIVYVGPGQGGKTTNLKLLNERLPADRCGRLVTLATEGERTLFFDFMPVALGLVNGFTTRFHLYTTPGQVYYRLSRRAVLQGVDALIFVADSHPAREEANRESLADIEAHLRTLGFTHEQRHALPWVVQYNKRDLPAAMPLARMKAALNPHGVPEFEAIATQGRGVSECLRTACKAALARLSSPADAVQAPRAEPPVASAPTPPHAAPVAPSRTSRVEVAAPRRHRGGVRRP